MKVLGDQSGLLTSSREMKPKAPIQETLSLTHGLGANLGIKLLLHEGFVAWKHLTSFFMLELIMRFKFLRKNQIVGRSKSSSELIIRSCSIQNT